MKNLKNMKPIQNNHLTLSMTAKKDNPSCETLSLDLNLTKTTYGSRPMLNFPEGYHFEIFLEGLDVSSSEVKAIKSVFSCVDGKWNQSDRIYGDIIPAAPESYVFPDISKQ